MKNFWLVFAGILVGALLVAAVLSNHPSHVKARVNSPVRITAPTGYNDPVQLATAIMDEKNADAEPSGGCYLTDPNGTDCETGCFGPCDPIPSDPTVVDTFCIHVSGRNFTCHSTWDDGTEEDVDALVSEDGQSWITR